MGLGVSQKDTKIRRRRNWLEPPVAQERLGKPLRWWTFAESLGVFIWSLSLKDVALDKRLDVTCYSSAVPEDCSRELFD